METTSAAVAEALTILDDLCRDCWEIHHNATSDTPKDFVIRDRREVFARAYERINALEPSTDIIIVKRLYVFPKGAGYRHRLKIARKLLLRLGFNIMTWVEEEQTVCD